MTMGQLGARKLAGVNLDKNLQAFKHPARPVPQQEPEAPLPFLGSTSLFNHGEKGGLATLPMPKEAIIWPFPRTQGT